MSKPSLLIPTEADYADAHEDEDQEILYRQRIDELRQKTGAFRWRFEVVKGFFKQAEDATDDFKFNYATEDFGRLKSWDQTIADLKELNLKAPGNEAYKLLFLARHGQGFHNVVINKYSYEEWYRKWYKETHDGDVEFAPDPMLTDLGINQAKENHELWKHQLAQGAPMPSKFYVSPLQRSSHTLAHTWTGLKPQGLQPVVTEGLRETSGLNLCDRRSTKSVIQQRFGQYGFVFEDGFTEEDEFFDAHNREKLHEHCIRTNRFLQRVFDEDYNIAVGEVAKQSAVANTFISTTSHAGTIRTFITVLGHRRFTISTGAMIPIVVRGIRLG
ncbi:putative phosphoglycerate mutase pmu1 [Yamadazyma tenuis]|uniref:Phosphoglycerate mutase-like protein n=1 Tax=Candida tenuis (strain ATCC 10573 / BCRC 21748 / CBS 615 / JCM 9827 / NBRC 10315 / NRRL Y-1498 / VKM Y-70) TaxID=590646 RepID=G3AW82_CANTC|nr:phosphoglycerate mutase-like protein [Yamadazyma tenuis ATCC 10573]EGV66478.1 phosphoglycerate mutase-like protein [Yamadazyma tenuis ATCC 10573]WEJ95407.1 putative phosphoglycerate mutase pmu1 [Yamadazyma tenuis]